LDFLAFFSVNLASSIFCPSPCWTADKWHSCWRRGYAAALAVERRLRLQQIGFVLLVCLMLFAIGNDVVRSFFH